MLKNEILKNLQADKHMASEGSNSWGIGDREALNLSFVSVH